MLPNIDGPTLANWLGYAGCAYCVVCILFQLRTWFLTIRLYKRFPIKASLRMLICRAKSKYVFHLFLGALAIGIMAALDVATNVEHTPGILAALGLFQVYLWIYHATPPAVLFLAGSRPEAIWLRHRLERSLHPYRIVVLLDPTRADMSLQTKWQLNHLEWDNVRAPFGDWRRPVHAIMGDVPFIVCDPRGGSPAVFEEVAHLCRYPELARKTVFVATSAMQSDLPPGCLGAVSEDEIAPLLTAAGLKGINSPDRYFAPIAGVDYNANYETGGETEASLVRLAASLSDPDESVRGAAFDALLNAGSRAVQPLIGVLESPARSHACFLLGQIGDPRALPALRRVLTRPGEAPQARERARDAIAYICELNDISL